MQKAENRLVRARRTWLEKGGYFLAAVGIAALLIGFVLPLEFPASDSHYHRVVPSENGWIWATTLTALGMVLVLVGRALRIAKQ